MVDIQVFKVKSFNFVCMCETFHNKATGECGVRDRVLRVGLVFWDRSPQCGALPLPPGRGHVGDTLA